MIAVLVYAFTGDYGWWILTYTGRIFRAVYIEV